MHTETKPAINIPVRAQAPIPSDVIENMTFGRIQNIEKSIVELGDVLESKLATVLMQSQPGLPGDDESPDQRTFLGRALTDVEIAIERVRSVLRRITI